MNNDAKSPAQGGGGHNRNKHNRIKPFYIKKKNDGEAKVQNTSEAAKNEDKSISSTAEANPSASENKEQRSNGSQGGNRRNHNRRDRNRGRHDQNGARDKQSKQEPLENRGDAPEFESALISEPEEYAANEAAHTPDLTPEVVVTIDDEVVEVEDDTPRVAVTGVRFKPGGKIYFFDPGDLTIKNNDFVIVDTARGLEYGEAAFGKKEVKETSLVLPLRQVVRVATKEDAERNAANKKMEAEALDICREKIEKHGLDMKLIEAQYSFDNSKLLFYFTSANRVDFRELVKDLAGVFRTRIELRQIGIRDEAKIMGGLGACGRPLCCASFLSDFVQVSIKMAKEQNLSLNSGKISGCCGRLMCCLQYEYQTYREEGAKTPPVDSTVKTADGVGVVTETNALAGTIKVRLKDKPDSPPALYKRDAVTVLSRAKRDDDEDEKGDK